MCENVDFELYSYPHSRGWGESWAVAYCPRCQKDHIVRADSAADASEGFGMADTPTHTTSECIAYLAEQLAEARGDIAAVESALVDARDSS